MYLVNSVTGLVGYFIKITVCYLECTSVLSAVAFNLRSLKQ